MNAESIFNGIGVDAITGVRLMDWLGVSPEELQVPQRFHRLKEVVNFLKQFPEDTQRFLVAKSTRGKLVDKLDHFYEYSTLLNEKQAREEEIKKIDVEKSAIEINGDPILSTEVAKRSLDARESLERIKLEIAIYE